MKSIRSNKFPFITGEFSDEVELVERLAAPTRKTSLTMLILLDIEDILAETFRLEGLNNGIFRRDWEKHQQYPD